MGEPTRRASSCIMRNYEPILQIIFIVTLMAFTGVIVSVESTFWEIIASIILAGASYSLAIIQSDQSRY